MFDHVPYVFAVLVGTTVQVQAGKPDLQFETIKASVAASARRQSEVMVDLYNCSMKATSPDGLAKCQAQAQLDMKNPARSPAPNADGKK